MNTTSNTIFGGPDKDKNILRDTLLAHIEALPSNSHTYWMSYYFNEPELFKALISASQRGVKVEIIIEGNARCSHINQACITTLNNHENIKIILARSKPIWEYIGIKWHAHMHSKLYYFSHPTPHAFIGSYNPTADTQSIDEKFIESIGDHTISHNVLVNINDNKLLKNTLNYFHKMQSNQHRRLALFSALNNKLPNIETQENSLESISLLPRLTPHPVNSLLKQKDNNAKILCAISHLKGPNIIKPLINASKAGKQIELILDSSKRRVPQKLLTLLERHHIKYRQLRPNHQHCLMHNKFIIYQSDSTHCVLFGSFNWSMRSWWLNHEIIVTTHNKGVISDFEARWQEMLALQ